MKALGIIRKMDDLGLVVVPKEVRDTQGWKVGQPLEMYMSNEGLVLKPYRDSEQRENALNILKRTLKFVEGEPATQIEKELKEVIEFLKKKIKP